MPVPERIVYTHGDTLPALDVTLTRGGRAELLVGRTVRVTILRPDPLANLGPRAATVLDDGTAANRGRARVSWLAGDLVNASSDEPLDYGLEFEVLTGLDKETAPDPVRFEVRRSAT